VLRSASASKAPRTTALQRGAHKASEEPGGSRHLQAAACSAWLRPAEAHSAPDSAAPSTGARHCSTASTHRAASVRVPHVCPRASAFASSEASTRPPRPRNPVSLTCIPALRCSLGGGAAVLPWPPWISRAPSFSRSLVAGGEVEAHGSGRSSTR
jgi:hypothetical protein